MKKRVISCLLATAMVFASVACGSEGTETTSGTTEQESSVEESSEEVSGEKVTLTIGTYSDPNEADLVTAQAEAYMALNENVELIVEPIAGDIWEVLKTRMASDNEPDIFYMDLFQSPQFIDAGRLAPLDDALTEEDRADFEESLLDAFTGEDGVLYGIPKDFSTLALFYNVQMFEEAGLEPPTTWEELEAAATALTKDGVVGLSLQNELPRCQPFFYSNGGSMMTDGLPSFNTPENIEAYEFWIGLINDGIAQTPQQLGVGWDGDAFAAEMVAMTIEGNWMIQSLESVAPDLEYGVVPVPVSKEDASMQFTVAYSMSNNTAHPEVAMDVINFLTSYEQQLVVAEAGRSMPSRNSALEVFVENFPERKVFVDVVPYASEFQYGIVSPTVVTEAALAMEKVLLDPSVTVQEAFDEAQANIEEALAQY